MNNKYNVLVTYEGDGDFRFKVKRIGEVIISKTKPIYIQNADVDIINDLRQLRRLLISVHIGASSEGAYKTYNVDDATALERAQARNLAALGKTALSNNEIGSILSKGTNGPIIEEEVPVVEEAVEEAIDEVSEEIDEIVEEAVNEVVEEEVKEETPVEEVKEEKPKAKSNKKKSNKKKR